MINKVILVGRLGADPEVRYLPDGKPVANIRVATDENWKDKNGEKQTKTEWHRIAAFGPLADIFAKYLTKGRLVFIEGRIQNRTWEDKDGTKRYATDIIATTMKMLDTKNGNGNGANHQPEQAEPGTIPEEDVPF